MRAALLLALGAGCVTVGPPPGEPKDAGVAEQGSAAVERLEKLDRTAAGVLQQVDEVLWAHWTDGGALELAPVADASVELVAEETLQVLRQIADAGVEPRRTAALTHWVAAQLVARTLAQDVEGLASLEASLSFQSSGRELRWVDLTRALATEKNAARRQAMWKDSMPLVSRVLARRKAVAASADQVARALGYPSAEALAAAARNLDPAATAELARQVLAATDEAWAEGLAGAARETLGESKGRVSWADLPRVLKVPEKVDSAITPSLVREAVLGTAALFPRVEVSLSSDATRNPLPLTVRGPDTARLALKPVGGLVDLGSALSELGATVALAARPAPLATDRLEDVRLAGAAGQLFSALAREPGWLSGRLGLADKVVPGAAAAGRLLALYAVRVACLKVLVRPFSGQPVDLELARRALGVHIDDDDAPRVALLVDDQLRGASTLATMLAGAGLHARLGADWWSQPDAGAPVVAALTGWLEPSAADVEALAGLLGARPAASVTAPSSARPSWPRTPPR